MSTVRMTRKLSFSSGHRYWRADLDADGNRALFGSWASPYNHGHNYRLEVTVEGAIDPRTGMVVNIKTVAEVLTEKVGRAFDQKSLNDEVPEFRDRAPTLENLLIAIRERLTSALPREASLVRLRLWETDLLFADDERQGKDWKMTLTRIYEFAASHRLHVPSMSNDENLELFGKCNNPAGHGHNYLVEVTVEGEPDPRTGMMVDLGALDEAVGALVVDLYDHKNLNVDLPEFQGRPTTSEVVAAEIFARLDGKVPGRLARVRLHETARNVFEVDRAYSSSMP